MENTKEYLNEYCKEKLEDSGFRITPQRMSIFRSLVESDSHPSAEMIYQKVRKEYPHISFDTVNRTLLCLLDKGLIQMVESGYGPRRFDADLKSHYHFRCIYCKKIFDFECKEYDQIKIPEKLKKRFFILSQHIVLEGICPECYKNAKKKKNYLDKLQRAMLK